MIFSWADLFKGLIIGFIVGLVFAVAAAQGWLPFAVPLLTP